MIAIPMDLTNLVIHVLFVKVILLPVKYPDLFENAFFLELLQILCGHSFCGYCTGKLLHWVMKCPLCLVPSPSASKMEYLTSFHFLSNQISKAAVTQDRLKQISLLYKTVLNYMTLTKYWKTLLQLLIKLLFRSLAKPLALVRMESYHESFFKSQ